MSDLNQATASASTTSFAERLIAWQATHGRNDLPWQVRDPYRVWLSEIMLQQTQVGAVMGYYARFIERFPTVEALAAAPLEDVLALWSGLGYYARARNLHRCAVELVRNFGGQFPQSAQQLAELPGIGPSTAAAIAAFCFGERAAILDGNVKRVLCRHLGVSADPSKASTSQQLWHEARQRLPSSQDSATLAQQMARYTQAIMDLGATVCTPRSPKCDACPVAQDCYAWAHGLTSSLPVKTARKLRPERSEVWLLLQHREQVWLRRQAATGLWGGLWVPPAFEALKPAQSWLKQQFGQELQAQNAMPAFTHAFTHYTLRVQPYWVCIPHLGDSATTGGPAGVCVAEGEQGLWLAMDQTQAVGLPTPVKRLLNALGQPRQMHLADVPLTLAAQS